MNVSGQTRRSEEPISAEQFAAAVMALGDAGRATVPQLREQYGEDARAIVDFLTAGGQDPAAVLYGVLIGRELYGPTADERRLLADFRRSTG